MVTLKRSPKNVELDISVAKKGNSAFFCGKQQIPWQTVNSAARHENPRAWNTAGPADEGSHAVCF